MFNRWPFSQQLRAIFLIGIFSMLSGLLPAVSVSAEHTSTKDSEKQFSEKFSLAYQHLQTAELEKAARAFEYLVERGSGKIKQDALEFLGVTYEQQNRIAKAKATYETFLTEYGKSEAGDRVKQRLAHLLESELVAKAPLSVYADKRRPKNTSDHQASLIQSYYMSNNNFDEGDYKRDQSLLYTYLNSDWRKRQNNHEYKTKLSMRYANNFRREENGPLYIKNAFLSYRNAASGNHLKVGRQPGHAYGISGRFDGVSGGVELSPTLASSLVVGTPVNYLERDSVNREEQAYGANVQYVSANDKLEVDAYLIRQNHQGFTNRSALGSNLRWQGEQKVVYGSADYDFYYRTHNLLQIQAEIDLDQSKLFLQFDDRRSPFVESSTALLAVTGLDDMDELRQLFSDEQIRQLALDLTGRARTGRAGLQKKFSDALSLTTEGIIASYRFSYMNLNNALQSHDDDSVSLNFRLVAQRLTQFYDTSVANIRLTKANDYHSLVSLISSRFNLKKRTQLTAKLRAHYRAMDAGEKQYQMTPAFLLRTPWNKSLEANLELGRSWIWYGGNSINRSYQRNYVNLGYSYRF